MAQSPGTTEMSISRSRLSRALVRGGLEDTISGRPSMIYRLTPPSRSIRLDASPHPRNSKQVFCKENACGERIRSAQERGVSWHTFIVRVQPYIVSLSVPGVNRRERDIDVGDYFPDERRASVETVARTLVPRLVWRVI